MPYYIVFAFTRNIPCFTIRCTCIPHFARGTLTSRKESSCPKSVPFMNARSAVLLYVEDVRISLSLWVGLQACNAAHIFDAIPNDLVSMFVAHLF